MKKQLKKQAGIRQQTDNETGKSSRRRQISRRPLTPPCVPFGTRRFDQLNMEHTFRCNNLTLRLVQIGLVSLCLSQSLVPFAGIHMQYDCLYMRFLWRCSCRHQALSGSSLCSEVFSRISICTFSYVYVFLHQVLYRATSYYLF